MITCECCENRLFNSEFWACKISGNKTHPSERMSDAIIDVINNNNKCSNFKEDSAVLQDFQKN